MKWPICAGSFLLALPLLSALVTGCSARQAVELHAPQGLVWPADNPRIALRRVIETTPSGTRQRGSNDAGATGLLERPHGVAWLGDDLVVVDTAAGRLVKIESGGRVHRTRRGDLVTPVDVTVCGDDLVVTDAEAGSVTRWTPDLEPAGVVADDLERPTGVACDDDRIFVVETGAHRVTVLEPGGTVRRIGGRGAEPGRFNFPTSVALDGDALMIGDTLNFRVQKVNKTTGEVIADFGKLGDSPGHMPRIKGIAVDGAGQVWVTDGHLDRVSVYGADGVLLISMGTTGQAPGQFSFPAGVAAHPDGRKVAVIDALNRRVQVFELLAGESVSPRIARQEDVAP